LQELALAGVKRLEATNLGNPRIMPQFKDAEEVLKGVRDEFFIKRLAGKGIKPEDIEWTAVTIREPGVDKAIRLKQQGIGPDRVLMMVSTDEQHHFANSGTTLPEYWKEAERCIKKCKDAGIKMCGTVSTIWGSPISGPTRFEDAVEFTKRWLSIGADDIEHADHDGSAPPNQVYRYYSMILDEIPNTDLHIGHFHVTRGWGLANVLAALQAGIDIFEGTLGGLGGQPANFLDRVPVPGTGSYYYKDPNVVGLATFEDMCVMLDEMGIDLCGVNVDRILELGTLMERTIGRRLRSEAILNGRVPKEPREEFKRAGLTGLKAKLKEKPEQLVPEGWPQKAVVPPGLLKRKS
jgi:hydroxymethylglutaryl-CoA lyase